MVNNTRLLHLSHIKAHSNHPGNDRADELANLGRTGKGTQYNICSEKIRKITLHTDTSNIIEPSSPLHILSIPSPDPRLQPDEFLNKYEDSRIPLSPYEMYEWAASHKSVPELDKISKSAFLQLNLHQQLHILHNHGHNITNMHEGLATILGKYHHLLPHQQLPTTYTNLKSEPIHRLIYLKHLMKVKIAYHQAQLKLHHKKQTRYQRHSHPDTIPLLAHIYSHNTFLSKLIKFSQVISKKLRTRLSSNQDLRRGNPPTPTAPIQDIPWHNTIQCLFPLKSITTSSTNITLSIPNQNDKPKSIQHPNPTTVHPHLKEKSIYTELEISTKPITVSHTTLHHQQFTTATVNINQLTTEKVHLLSIIMRQQQIDILGIVDIRLTSRPIRWCKHIIHDILGPGSQTHYNAAKVKSKSNSTHPGGIFTIVSPRFSGYPITFIDDRTGLGIFTQCRIALQQEIISFTSTYWPCIHSPQDLKKLPGSLHSLLIDWMSKHHIFQPPLQYIQQSITTMLPTSENNATIIIAGDFNFTWSDTKNNTTNQSLRSWANDLKVSNPAVDHSSLYSAIP